MDLEIAFAEVSMMVGRCGTCDRRVLTYPASDLDEPHHHCVHCDSLVTEDVRATDIDGLPEHGYGLLELQGCGNPDCGGGACGRKPAAE